MGLLDRLNIFRRVKDLEEQESKLLDNIDVLRVKLEEQEVRSVELEQGLEHILNYMDVRSESLRRLNHRILMVNLQNEGSLDLVPDLDVEMG